MINIPDAKCAIGVTNGSVIRYDPTANNSSGLYKLSVANNTASAEVVGIVESINSDNSKNVVIYGSINLPNSAIEDIPAGYSGGSGGSDIYFLSPTSSGKIRNNAPTDLKHIVKPIYQTAPHGNGSYTGVVMNYIGYKVPSEITVFNSSSTLPPLGTIEVSLLPQEGGAWPVSKYKQIGTTDAIRTTTDEFNEYKQKYRNWFGKVFKVNFTPIATNNNGGPWPVWDPNNYPPITEVEVFTTNGIQTSPPNYDVDMRNNYLLERGIYATTANSPNTNFLPNTEYFLKKPANIGGAPIGGIIVNSITENTDNITLPLIENLLRLFIKSDQDDNIIPNSIEANLFNYFIKVKKTETANLVQSLESNSVEVDTFNLNGNNLITTINNLESRILAAEVEVGR